MTHRSSNRLALRSCTVYPHALHISGLRPWRTPVGVDSSGRFTVSTRLNQGLMWAAIVAAMAVTPVLTLAQREGGAAPGAQGAPAGGGARGGGRGAANLPPAGPTPRLPNGKPDLSGHWTNPYTPDMAARGSVLDPKTRMPLQFARMGEPLPDARPSATGRGARTYDLPYTDKGLK